MRRARLARLCDSAWRVRCTPARLNIATTITEDPIVPSPHAVAVSVAVPAFRAGITNFRSHDPGSDTTVFASARGPREPGPGRFRSQFADPEARPARGCRCAAVRSPAHTRSRTNGRSAVKTGARASQPSMEPVETWAVAPHSLESRAGRRAG